MIVDVEKLKTYLSCGDEFAAKVLKGFIEEALEIAKKIEHALLDEHWKVVQGQAHKLLSSTRTLQLKTLSEQFEYLEEIAGKGEDGDQITKQAKLALDQLYIAIKDVENYLNNAAKTE